MRTQFETIQLKTYLCGALLLGAGLLPSTALAQDPSSANAGTATKVEDPTLSQPEGDISASESTEQTTGLAADGSVDTEPEKDKKGWSVSAGVSTRFYQGMFVDLGNTDSNISSPYASDTSNSFSRWSNIYTLGAAYKLSDFNFGVNAAASHWLSRSGGIDESNEFRFQDLALTAGWNGYTIDPIDTKFSATYSLILPTSQISRASNLNVGNYLGLSLSRTFFEKLSLSYTLSGGWTPHSTPVATGDPDDIQIYREDEVVGNEIATVGNFNTQFSLTNSFVASIPVWEKLRAAVSYSYSGYWTYGSEDDDDGFTAQQEGIQTGRNYGDSTTATAGLSYPIGDYISVAGGISTSQQPKTSDNKSFRFPWWNFSGAAGNRSSINLSVSGSY